jgi:type IV fimbrial biogenesis protein FimT
MNIRHRHTGVTLIELMVTIAVLAIVAVFAVPEWLTTVRNNRLAAQANDLVADLALARSEAMRRGGRVTICASADGTVCSGDAADWKQGRLVFFDANADGTVGAGDEIIRAAGNLKGNALSTSSFASSDFIQFRPSGMPVGAGSFKLCDQRAGAYGRQISIAAAGMVSLQREITCP